MKTVAACAGIGFVGGGGGVMYYVCVCTTLSPSQKPSTPKP